MKIILLISESILLVHAILGSYYSYCPPVSNALTNPPERANRLSLWYPFCTNVERFADNPCIWSRGSLLTWQQVHDRAGQYAKFFISHGVKPGDLVAFYLQNSPDFLIAWLALWCIGCAPALINFNLKAASLTHCLELSRSKLLLVDEDAKCREKIEESRSQIQEKLGMKIIVLDSITKTDIRSLPSDIPDDTYRQSTKGSSPTCLIFTRYFT